MQRLATVALGAVLASACAQSAPPAETTISTPVPTVSLSATPATPASSASSPPSASFATGVLDGGSGWGASASALTLGDRATFTCPPGGAEYAIWGTAVYTSDSSVCTAGVHVGILSFAIGGAVVVDMIDGQAAYVGSTLNGVTSRDYASYPASFTFAGSPPSFAPPSATAPSGAPPSLSLTDEAAALLAHVPAALQGDCRQVTSFDAGVIVAIQCINIPDMDGYVTYKQFDSDTNAFASFDGNYEFFGAGDASGSDCAVGPSLVAHNRDGFPEGRLFCNAWLDDGPDTLISIWFDLGLLIEAAMVTYGYSYADNHALYLTAGPIE